MRFESELEVDLSAIDHNVRVLRGLIGPEKRICAVVKSDAYSMGAVRVAKRLEAAGIDMFAVFAPYEAVQLFAANVARPVLVLMPMRELDRADELYRGLIRGLLHLTVHDLDQLRELEGLADRFGTKIPLHLEIDSGMGRGGCDPEEASHVLRKILAHPRLELAGIFTHFGTAKSDPKLMREQAKRFSAFIKKHESEIPQSCLKHIANTAACLRDPSLHWSMVRVGFAWIGYSSFQLTKRETLCPAATELRPAVRWTSRIVLTKTIEAGRKVGYGAQWTPKRKTLLGLVPVGYADGLPVTLASTDDRPVAPCVGIVPSHAPHLVRFAPVIGALSMDQLTLDLTDVAQDAVFAGDPPAAGTVVELLSPNREAPNHLISLAEASGRSPYEVLSRLHPRVRRVYRVDSPVVEIKPQRAELATLREPVVL